MAELSRGDVEIGEGNGMLRRDDFVVISVLSQMDGAETTVVPDSGPIIPSLAELGVAEWVRDEVGGVMITTKLMYSAI